MANTYTQLHIHVVFSVQNRKPLLNKEWREHIFAYMGATLKKHECQPLAINGVEDHVHIFFGLNPSKNLSDLVKTIKSASTSFIKEHYLPNQKFRWQLGYAAFSHSHSAVKKVVNYIHNQEQHHAKKDYETELIQMLELYEVDYNPKYLI